MFDMCVNRHITAQGSGCLVKGTIELLRNRGFLCAQKLFRLIKGTANSKRVLSKGQGDKLYIVIGLNSLDTMTLRRFSSRDSSEGSRALGGWVGAGSSSELGGDSESESGDDCGSESGHDSE